MEDHEYDPSDYEDGGEDAFALSSTAGRRTTQEVIDNQMSDRKASKRSVRTLQLGSAVPGTNYLLSSAKNNWDAFANSINLASGTCPTGEHIYRSYEVTEKRGKPYG